MTSSLDERGRHLIVRYEIEKVIMEDKVSAYASQFTRFLKKVLDFDILLEEGKYEPINQWLKENLHQYGSLKTLLNSLIMQEENVLIVNVT